jgi:peptidoglycan hydrolase-like protein with peptidoglycan-binding domain
MTVSIRIAGKLVHVSSVSPRTSHVDVGSCALLRRVQLDSAGIQALRSMLVVEMGPAVQRMSHPQVIEEAVKRVLGGRWSLSVVDEQKVYTGGAQGQEQTGADGQGAQGAGSGTGRAGVNDPLTDKKKTWVEFELLDKNKHPVKGLNFEVTLPDGIIEKGALSEKGSFRKDGIDPGTCRVRFPDLDGREWAKASSFAEGQPVTLFSANAKIAAGPYTVVQGDHVASIAADAGYLSWKTIWDDGKNAALKAKRNPNVLYPGDVLEIPAKQKKEESIPTTEYSTFQTIGDPVQLKIVVLDWAGNPIVDTDLDIQLDAGEKLKTAGDGSATKKVVDPQGNRVGQLLLKGYTLALKLGHLDPVEELSGQRARLNNLGYQAGDGDASDPDFRSAVEEFQCDHGLTVDGICGSATQAKLKDVHGS